MICHFSIILVALQTQPATSAPFALVQRCRRSMTPEEKENPQKSYIKYIE